MIWMPAIARISVDLPQPLGPSSPVTDPVGTDTVRSGITVFFPRITVRRSTSMAGLFNMR